MLYLAIICVHSLLDYANVKHTILVRSVMGAIAQHQGVLTFELPGHEKKLDVWKSKGGVCWCVCWAAY